MGTRPFCETLAAIWSSALLVALAVGGTMIMRKFHSSLTVGFFLGTIVATSQLFLVLFLLYIGYSVDQKQAGLSNKEENIMATLALIQSLLLSSFAIILAAHRSEILTTTAVPESTATGPDNPEAPPDPSNRTPVTAISDDANLQSPQYVPPNSSRNLYNNKV
jgi:hypothetical protein